MTDSASNKSVTVFGRGNLEQIRARVALKGAKMIGTGKDGGLAVAKKVPAMIVQNGFLAALAFALESVSGEKEFDVVDGFYRNGEKNQDAESDPYKGCGYANTFISIMEDLRQTRKDLGICSGTLSQFLGRLCERSSIELRLVTDEALSYLNYLRRFAKPDKSVAQDKEKCNVPD